MRMIGDVSWRALWPARILRAGSVPNNASVVLDAVVAGERVLLTGDVEREAQSDLLPNMHAFDVVKVPHHGSGNAVIDLASKAPAPFALISVGAGNSYGHPAQTTVDSWARAGAVVLRTDLSGDIAMVNSPAGLAAVTRG
jgi:competence protein ComEC